MLLIILRFATRCELGSYFGDRCAISSSGIGGGGNNNNNNDNDYKRS